MPLPPSYAPMEPLDPSQDQGYLEWLKQRGMANPYVKQPQQQVQKPEGERPLMDLAKGIFGSDKVASTALENTSYNTGAGEASNLAWNSGASQAYQTANLTGGEIAGLPSVNAGGILSNASGMGAGPLAGIAAGTYLGGKAAYDMFRGNKPNLAGRVTLGVATGGLSEVANKFLGHKSTRDIANENTKNLLSLNKDDSNYQNYVQGMRQQYSAPPPDPSKPFAGKYATWEDYKKGGLDAGNLTGVLGNVKTFGSDWSNMDFDQQKAMTQKFIDAGLYNSKKGEVVFTDENKAKEIFGQPQGIVPPQAMAQVQPSNRFATNSNVPAPMMIPRSKTLSPGIGKDGKRIVYSK